MTQASDEWSGPWREFAFPVEAGHLLGFCRAIGAPVPADGAAPLTFAAATDHFDPAYTRRPPLGSGWTDLPVSHLHVEQHFDYARAIRAGEQLTARKGPGRVWEKIGRSGRLRFVEERTELRDAAGACVQVMRWVDVHTEQSHGALTNAQRDPAASGTTRPTPAGRPVVVATDLSRTQFVMYAGASGDFHPLHHDDDLAQRHGYPSVFCPGMLTMALSARALDTVAPTTTWRSLSSRFRAQVWPGDTLTAYATVDTDAVRLVTVNQHRTVVLETTAVPAA